MRIRLEAISDRLLEKVTPKAKASAVDCWQGECLRRSCLGRTTTWMLYDPCNDRQKVGYCGC